MQHATTSATRKLRRPVPRRATALAAVAAAAALLLARPSPARAENDLIVDVANHNSPYTFTTNLTEDNITGGNTGVGVLNQTAYDVTTSFLYLGNATGSNGTYNLSGTGYLTAGDEMIGVSGSGSFIQSGGTNFVKFFMYLGDKSGGNGSYTLSAGTLTVSQDDEDIGESAGGSGTFIQSGGTNTIGENLALGDSAGASGSYTLSGTGVLSAKVDYIGNSGSGTFTQNGGTNTVSIILDLADGSGTKGTYNLNGGTLAAPRLVSGSGTSTFNFNGGTLQAGSANPNYYFIQGLTTANVQSGGAIIDTNGFNVTVAQPLLHDTTAGAPAADGGLTKVGAGTLTLYAVNTYNGPTTVNAGTLQLGRDTAGGTFGNNSAVTLANGSGVTLDLNGINAQIGSLTGGGSSGGNVTLGSATLTVGGDNTSPAAFAGVISGGGGLVETGTGTLTLSGNNSYAGTTSVNGGTLLVNGTHSGTGLVTVQNSGSVLGGTGTLAAAVNVTTGTLAPGILGTAGSPAKVGKLTVGALTLSSTATSVFVIYSTTYDQLFANGNVALGGSLLTLSVSPKSTFTMGQTLDLFHDNSGTLSGVFSDFANNGLYTYGAHTFRANYTATDFTLTVVPEPATWAGGALLLGAAVLTLRRRTRFSSRLPRTFACGLPPL